jgi:hypothetical protein
VKLRKKLLAIVLSTIMAMSMVFYFPGQARADALDNVVSELQKTYVWLDKDPDGKASVAQAKTLAGNISNNPSNAPWPAVFSQLPVNKLVGTGKFANESEAKLALVDLFLDAAIIGYSSDAGVLKTNLENFKIKHTDTIYKVMGNDVTVDDLYNYALQTKKEIPGIITQDISGLIAIAGGDYSTIREQVKDWLRQALIKADTDYFGGKYQNKLIAIGWSIDALVEAKDIISKEADPDCLAEIALLKAYVRSETRFLKNGVALAPETKISLCQGGSLPCKLSILGITDIYGINIANVFKWQSGNESVIKIEDHTIKAIGTGTAEIIAYNENPATDWVYKGTVEVAVCPAPGGGGGGGGAPAPSCLDIEKLTPVKDAVYVELDAEVSAAFKKEIEAVSTTELAKITIKDAKGNAVGGIKVSVKDKKLNIEHNKFVYNTKYTTTIPEKSVKNKTDNLYNCKVEWSFTTKEEPKPPDVLCVFNDLTKEHWAYECIMTLCRKGIVGGYPDKTFRPGRNITRAEFTKLLVETLELAKETPARPTFEDVKPADWHYECVEAAAKAGLIRGYKGKFRPNDFITRQEMTAIMIRAMGKESEALAKVQEKIDMADEAQISSWARGCVVLALESGLIGGYPDKTLRPKKNTTRAEAMVIICRFKKY